MWDMEAVNRWHFKVPSDLGAGAEQHRGCYGSFRERDAWAGVNTWGSAFVIERVAKMHKWGVGVGGREMGAGSVDATINNVLQSNYRVIGCRVRGANACKLTFCGAWMWEEPRWRSLCLSHVIMWDVNSLTNHPVKHSLFLAVFTFSVPFFLLQ